MSGQHHTPSSINVPIGDAAQMEQIRQSLASVATQAAEQAAQRTVERLFLNLGVDVSKPEGILRLQRVLTFGGDMLDARDTIRKQTIRSAVVVLIPALLAMMAYAMGFPKR